MRERITTVTSNGPLVCRARTTAFRQSYGADIRHCSGRRWRSRRSTPLTKRGNDRRTATNRNGGTSGGGVPAGAINVTSAHRASAAIQIDPRSRSPVYGGHGNRDVMISAFMSGEYTTDSRRKGSSGPATD